MSDYSDANWWRRSSYCGASAGCVDVRRDGDKIQVRDSKVAPEDALVLSWSVDEWRELLDAIRRGTDHDDLTEDHAGVWIGTGHYLFFGPDEWAAFVKGVKAGEFDVDRLSSPVPVSGGLQVDGANEVGPAANGPNLAATGAAAIAVQPVPVAAPCPSWCDARHLPTWPVHSADMGEDIELGDDSALSVQVVDYGAGSGPVIALAVHTGGEDGETLVIDLPLNQAFELRAALEDAFDAIASDSVAVARAAAHRVDYNPETPGTADPDVRIPCVACQGAPLFAPEEIAEHLTTAHGGQGPRPWQP